jgi:hypothetical protein
MLIPQGKGSQAYSKTGDSKTIASLRKSLSQAGCQVLFPLIFQQYTAEKPVVFGKRTMIKSVFMNPVVSSDTTGEN